MEREGITGGSPDEESEGGEGMLIGGRTGGEGVGATGAIVSEGGRVVTMGHTAWSGSVKAVYDQASKL